MHHDITRPGFRPAKTRPVIVRTAPHAYDLPEQLGRAFGETVLPPEQRQTLIEITNTEPGLLAKVDVAYLYPYQHPDDRLAVDTDYQDRLAAANLAPLLIDRLVLIEGGRTALAFEILIDAAWPLREWHPVKVDRTGGHFLAAVVPSLRQIAPADPRRIEQIARVAGLVGDILKTQERNRA